MESERHITFIVTKDCQLRCKYCYLVGKNSFERLDFTIAAKAVDYILSESSFDRITNIVFDFIGGEPLLEIALIDRICDYIIDRLEYYKHPWLATYKFGITTNGILYNSPNVQNFISKHQGRVEISISIDGNKKKNDLNRVFPNGSGSYDAIIDNVRLWLSQGTNVITKMVISSKDLPDVFESAVHLLELGVKRLDMNPVLEDVWNRHDEIIYEQQLCKLADYIIDNNLYEDRNIYVFEDAIGHPLSPEDDKSPCRESLISIDASGNFYSCLRLAKFSLQSKEARTVGNIVTGINKNHLRAFLLLSPYCLADEKCLECEIASGCRWCPGVNYDESSMGSIYERATAVCRLHHARVRAKNYYWYKLLCKEGGKKWNL